MGEASDQMRAAAAPREHVERGRPGAIDESDDGVQGHFASAAQNPGHRGDAKRDQGRVTEREGFAATPIAPPGRAYPIETGETRERQPGAVPGGQMAATVGVKCVPADEEVDR